MNIEQLKLDNEKLNARLEKAKEVFKQQAADAKAKDEAYLKLRDEYNEVIKERDTHIEANAKLNKQLADAGYDRESYVGQIDALNDTINGLNATINELKSKHADYAELDALATSRLADINKLKEEVEKQDKIIDGLTEEESKLSQKYADALNAVDEANYNIDALKEKLDIANKLNEELTKEIEEKNSIINDCDAEIDRLSEELNGANDKIKVLTDKANAQENTVNEIKSKVETKVAVVKKALQTLNDGLGDEFNIFG